MAKKPIIPDLTAEQARELLRYDPETGHLFWRPRSLAQCANSNAHSTFNTRFAGALALAHVDQDGYHYGNLLGHTYRTHRVIWLMQTGEWPAAFIDHINGVRSDNRWSNLRVVSPAENMRNVARLERNTSGVTGVHWNKRQQNWQAYIQIGGRLQHLGTYATLEEAATARAAANESHGFSKRHGSPRRGI